MTEELKPLPEIIDRANDVLADLKKVSISAAIVGEKCPDQDYLVNHEKVVRARQFIEYSLLPYLAAPQPQTADEALMKRALDALLHARSGCSGTNIDEAISELSTRLSVATSPTEQ